MVRVIESVQDRSDVNGCIKVFCTMKNLGFLNKVYKQLR
jgi:hypothetical protein